TTPCGRYSVGRVDQVAWPTCCNAARWADAALRRLLAWGQCRYDHRLCVAPHPLAMPLGGPVLNVRFSLKIPDIALLHPAQAQQVLRREVGTAMTGIVEDLAAGARQR